MTEADLQGTYSAQIKVFKRLEKTLSRWYAKCSDDAESIAIFAMLSRTDQDIAYNKYALEKLLKADKKEGGE